MNDNHTQAEIDDLRRQQLAEINGAAATVAAANPDDPDGAILAELRRKHGDDVYTTDQLQEAFTVVGFAAPLVVVVRKSDGAKGSLTFTHRPRFYFHFQPHAK